MIRIIIVTTVLTFSVSAQIPFDRKNTSNQRFKGAKLKCEPNVDGRFGRIQILRKLAVILDKTAVKYYNAVYKTKKTTMKMTGVDGNGRPIGFFVYDLTKPSNKTEPLSKCIEFKNGHIYHFSIIQTSYSFSHILILQDDKLKVFEAINCKDGDRLKDILKYLCPMLKGKKNKLEIIDRLKDYRNYGVYFAIDDSKLKCESGF